MELFHVARFSKRKDDSARSRYRTLHARCRRTHLSAWFALIRSVVSWKRHVVGVIVVRRFPKLTFRSLGFVNESYDLPKQEGRERSLLVNPKLSSIAHRDNLAGC